MRIDSSIPQKRLPTSLIARIKPSAEKSNEQKSDTKSDYKPLKLTNTNTYSLVEQLHRQIAMLEQKELELESKTGVKLYCGNQKSSF